MEMPLTEGEVLLFQSLVEDWSGILLSDKDLSALNQAVGEGMADIGVEAPREYCTHLRSFEGREELDRFTERLTNNEAYFFREPDHFKALTEHLLPEIVERRLSVEEKVRILSAGCSTGEEPYSIAIALLECQEHFPRLEFEIVGVDIDRKALATAKEGIFRRNSFRNTMDTARIDAWFERLGDGRYRLCDEIRDRVLFRYLNLHAERSLEDTLGEMDVIFFRNVSIYLSPNGVGRVNRRLASCLKQGGYFLVGSAEVQQHNRGRLLLREVGGVFLFQKAERRRSGADADQEKGSAPELDRSPRPVAPSVGAKARSERKTGRGVRPEWVRVRQKERMPAEVAERPGEKTDVEALYKAALEGVVEERKEAALEKLRRILEIDPGHVDACHLMAEIYLNGEAFDEAAALCHRALETDPWLAWPHLFLGLICRHEGNHGKATVALKTAIYMKPDAWLAHFYLGEIYRISGRRSLAVREYRNVLNALEKGDGEEEMSLISGGFSPEYIVRACKENVRNLTGLEASPPSRP